MNPLRVDFLRSFRGRLLVVTLVSSIPPVRAAEPGGPIVLTDVAARAGVDFRYVSGTRGKHDLPEIMGGGVALIDGDGDGHLDLFFGNGGPIGGDPGRLDDSPCRYFRNKGDGTFVDATEAAHAPGPSYAMGMAVGDFDGDGRDDLFVSGWRGQTLYRNLGAGRFEDVTGHAGVASTRWGTSAAWADLDRDGDLDLYVATYLTYDPDHAPYCAAPDGSRDYCGPEEFPAERDHLYRNNGDGTFTDVAEAAGIDSPVGRGLGVTVADLVGDSRLDIFVANDGTACRLHENLGGLRFREVGERAGVAVDGMGQPLAGMGIAVADLDADGRPDLAVSNFFGRGTVGFRRLGPDAYADASGPLGLTTATRRVLGFGLAAVDLDGDGRPDLIQANGHVVDRDRLGVPLAMRPTLLRNAGGRFVDASEGAGDRFARAGLGRGLAVGDLDSDGRPDVVMNVIDGPAAVLMNRSAGRSVGIALVGKNGRAALGARVKAGVGGTSITLDMPGGGSYLAASEPKVFVGLGDANRIDRLEVAWPSGTLETYRDLAAGKGLRIVEGGGRKKGDGGN